jgi:hypothetical protein
VTRCDSVARHDPVLNESRPGRLTRCATPALLIVLAGLAIGIGAVLPWMYYFAGLVPLRGVIGLNGRLLLAAGVLCVALGVVVGRGTWLGRHIVLRRVTAVMGIVITCVAVWLVIGVGELARARGESAMLALRPGPGLFVVGLGGLLLALTACIPERYWHSDVPLTPENQSAMPTRYRLPVTRHTVLPTSSATRSAPRLSIATPTGLPSASPFSFTKPERTSSGPRDGVPPLNGTKITL